MLFRMAMHTLTVLNTHVCTHPVSTFCSSSAPQAVSVICAPRTSKRTQPAQVQASEQAGHARVFAALTFCT